MNIELNGLAETVPDGITIAGLIDLFKEGDPDLIVEQNGRYIYPKDYHTRKVEDKDSIEFINPNLGG